MTVDLDQRWRLHRESVEAALRGYLPTAGCPPRLREAMEYSLLAGGKRLRPVLTLLACEACGGPATAALPAACALEMIHTYSLIHDDLPSMDDDDLRRGRPTNHKVFGEALAILAGDALLTLGFEVLMAHTQPSAVAAACCVDLAIAAGAGGMVGGQVADLEAEEKTPTGDAKVDGDRLVAIHRRKTGALIGCAASMGARIAGVAEQTRSALEEYGRDVGLTFQIADDLLDVTGNRDRMGKGVRKDDSHGKLTYPSIYGVDGSRHRAEELVDRACSAVAPLGPAGEPLADLARFVLARDH